jgi:hypothetical protein
MFSLADPAARRTGDRHPLAESFLHFSKVKTKRKRAMMARIGVETCVFDHDRHSFGKSSLLFSLSLFLFK